MSLADPRARSVRRGGRPTHFQGRAIHAFGHLTDPVYTSLSSGFCRHGFGRGRGLDRRVSP